MKQEKRRSSLAQQRKAHHQPILAQHTVLHYTTTLVFFLPSHEPKRASFGTSASSAQRSSLMERQNFFITFLYSTHSATKCWSDQNFSKSLCSNPSTDAFRWISYVVIFSKFFANQTSTNTFQNLVDRRFSGSKKLQVLWSALISVCRQCVKKIQVLWSALISVCRQCVKYMLNYITLVIFHWAPISVCRSVEIKREKCRKTKVLLSKTLVLQGVLPKKWSPLLITT